MTLSYVYLLTKYISTYSHTVYSVLHLCAITDAFKWEENKEKNRMENEEIRKHKKSYFMYKFYINADTLRKRDTDIHKIEGWRGVR